MRCEARQTRAELAAAQLPQQVSGCSWCFRSWDWDILCQNGSDSSTGLQKMGRKEKMQMTGDSEWRWPLIVITALIWHHLGMRVKMQECTKQVAHPFNLTHLLPDFAARLCTKTYLDHCMQKLNVFNVTSYCSIIYVGLRLTSFCVCLWRSWKNGKER